MNKILPKDSSLRNIEIDEGCLFIVRNKPKKTIDDIFREIRNELNSDILKIQIGKQQ